MVAALAAGVVSFPLSDRCSYAHRSWHRFVLAGSIHARP
jgi:predicted membrane channel-forming protein YqfA (hemolysin III family)